MNGRRKRRLCGPGWSAALASLPVLAISSGCALDRLGSQEVSQALERYETQQSVDSKAYSTKAKRRGGSATAEPEVERLVDRDERAVRPDEDLASLILFALEHNPDIQAAAETARSMAARVPQVTALPDPTLSTRILPEPIRTAEGDNYFVLGVRQTFPFPEKLNRRGRMALEQTREAIAKLKQQRLHVVAEIKRAYFQLYVVDRTAQVIRDNQDLLRRLIDVARGQLVAGRRSQQDVLRTQVALSELESQLVELRQRRGVIEARINRLLSRPVTTAVRSAGEIGIRDFEVTLERLLAHARQENPRLAELRYMIERERHGVRLARLAYWPDLTVGFEWITMAPRTAFKPPINQQTGRRPPAPMLSEEASDNWAITASLNLPIWFQKIEAGVREARHRLSAARQRYQAGRDEVDYRVEDALVSVQAQRDLAEIFGGTIVPQAKQAYEVSLADYTAGTEDFQAAIDNWRRWLTFTIQYHRALGELERSVADLEETLGMAIVSVASDQATGAPSTEPAPEETQVVRDVSPTERIDGGSQ